MTHEHHPPATLADTYYEAFFSAALGGGVIALYFLAVDVLAGRPLFTPSLLGTVLLTGAEAESVQNVRLDAVALFSVIHFMTFGALGLAASWLVRALEEKFAGGFAIPVMALFAVIGGGFWVASGLFLPGVVGVMGQGNLIIASALTALAMTAFLRHAHETSENAAESGSDADALTPRPEPM